MLALVLAFTASAQTLYKYRGENGEWIYSDRPPADGKADETRKLEISVVKGTLDVFHEVVDGKVLLLATNRYFAPVEVTVEFDHIQGLAFPHPDQELRWTLPPRSETTLLSLEILDTVAAPSAEYSASYALCDS